MKKGAIKPLVKRLILCCFVLVLIFVLPLLNLKADDNMDLIYRSFVGKKSDYQGFIEVWNIDTFEACSVSKTDLLKKIAKTFQDENRGTYVIVRNVSESECKNMLMQGQMPDVFTCSYGVAAEIKEYLVPFESSFDGVYQNYLNAGKVDGLQYAVPWCLGNYYLISTKGRISKFYEENKDVRLSDIALQTGMIVETKKGEKITYSLGMGAKGYVMPQLAYKTYTGKGINLDLKESIDAKRIKTSSLYDAYCDFISEKCNILLGSQKDLARVVAREKAGKLSDVVMECVEGFSDLVQFAMLANRDEEKKKYAELFVQKLIEEKSQEVVSESGMFAVKHTTKQGVMSNITPKNFSDYTCFNLFISKSEIKNLQVFS